MLLRAGDLLVQRVPKLRWWAMVEDEIDSVVFTEQGTPATVLRHSARDSLSHEADCLDVVVDGRQYRAFVKPSMLEQLWEVTCIQ